MAVVDINVIKNWFKTGLIPTQAQFWSLFDSYRHKNDKVPVADVEGINELLAQVTSVTIYKRGQLCIFKNPGNESDNNLLKPGDTVIGFVEGDFLNSATYYGGNPMLLSSYEDSNFIFVSDLPIAGLILGFFNDDYGGNDSINLVPTDKNLPSIVLDSSQMLFSYSIGLDGVSASYNLKVEYFKNGDWTTAIDEVQNNTDFFPNNTYFFKPEKIKVTVQQV